MVLAFTLFKLALLAVPVLGHLPPSGGPYLIQNPATSFVVDDRNSGRNAGSPIQGYTVNPTAKDAQFIFIEQTGTAGTSGIYSFVIPTLGLGIFSNGLQGGGLTAQNFTSLFVVTETSPGSDVFNIAFPFKGLSIATTFDLRNQLTLQPTTLANKLQQWTFVPQPYTLISKRDVHSWVLN